VLTELYAFGTSWNNAAGPAGHRGLPAPGPRFDNTYRDVSTRLAPDGCRTRQTQVRTAASARRHTRRRPYGPRECIRAPARQLAAAAAADATVSPLPPVDNYNVAPDGTERLGRYQLEREIGRGAMGIVYLGARHGHQSQVAIKAIPWPANSATPNWPKPGRASSAKPKPRVASIIPTS
jgi:hypothetical protein